MRADLFKKIDENEDGGISFDEWLAFALKHYRLVNLEDGKKYEYHDTLFSSIFYGLNFGCGLEFFIQPQVFHYLYL